jgi:hypothetical protein
VEDFSLELSDEDLCVAVVNLVGGDSWEEVGEVGLLLVGILVDVCVVSGGVICFLGTEVCLIGFVVCLAGGGVVVVCLTVVLCGVDFDVSKHWDGKVAV